MISAEDVLVVIALPEEAGEAFAATRSRLCFSGIGKINATYALARAVMERRPRLVVNFGTAGSPLFQTHAVVECTQFVQRDIDLSPLGFPKGSTPFDKVPAVLGAPRRLADLHEGVCGTGDNFETMLGPVPDGLAHPHATEALVRPNVIEMEAYALAKVCWHERLPFVCVKYITDGSDANANNDWVANVPRAAAVFGDIYKRLLSFDFARMY